MVKLAIWNSATLVCKACQPRGGFLKIRPSNGESESIFSSFSVENNGIQFIIYIIQGRIQGGFKGFHGTPLLKEPLLLEIL